MIIFSPNTSFWTKKGVIWWLFHDDLRARERQREKKVITKSPPLTEWENIVPMGPYRKCFRIIIPKKIAIEGIGSVMFKSKPFYKLYVHQHGLLRSNMAGSFPVSYYNEFSKLTVTHEILELLDYAGDICINNKDYEYDRCRQNYIFQVL